MQKLLLALLLFVTLISNSQPVVFKIADTYYRSDPFEKPFNKFLEHLVNDPTLENKTIKKKTDSTLFFLEGTYKRHSPFFFRNIGTKIVLAEQEEIVSDSLQLVQTTYVYQIIGYAPAGESGVEDVKAEFEKFCKKYRNKFGESNYKELTQGDTKSGEMRNYMIERMNFYPLTVAWATTSDKSNNIFAITLRFRMAENTAYLPIPFYGF